MVDSCIKSIMYQKRQHKAPFPANWYVDKSTSSLKIKIQPYKAYKNDSKYKADVLLINFIHLDVKCNFY